MPGINWKYNNDSKSRKFWSTSSDYYIFLSQLLNDFDVKFNQTLNSKTSEYHLTEAQLDFLINGLEIRIEQLLKDFNPIVQFGVNSVATEYDGKKYEFYTKMSRDHRLVNGLIRFHKFLNHAQTNGLNIKFWGEI